MFDKLRKNKKVVAIAAVAGLSGVTLAAVASMGVTVLAFLGSLIG